MDTFDLLNEACDLYIKALSEGCCKKESCCKSEECNKDESCEKNEGCCKKENCNKAEACNESAIVVLDESISDIVKNVIEAIKKMIATVKKKIRALFGKLNDNKAIKEQGKYAAVVGSSYIADKDAFGNFKAFINSFQSVGGNPADAWEKFDKCFSDDVGEASYFTYYAEAKEYVKKFIKLLDYCTQMAESKVRVLSSKIEEDKYEDDDVALLNNCKYVLGKVNTFCNGNFEVRTSEGKKIVVEPIDIHYTEIHYNEPHYNEPKKERTSPKRTVNAYA